MRKTANILMIAAATMAAHAAAQVQSIGQRIDQPLPYTLRNTYGNELNRIGTGRRSRKNKFAGGSFMGPGVRNKKTNKIHRSRMTKNKHRRAKK